MVPWVGMQCVIVTFPDHTHLRSAIFMLKSCLNKGCECMGGMYTVLQDFRIEIKS